MPVSTGKNNDLRKTDSVVKRSGKKQPSKRYNLDINLSTPNTADKVQSQAHPADGCVGSLEFYHPCQVLMRHSDQVRES